MVFEPGLPRLTTIPLIFLSGQSWIIWKIRVSNNHHEGNEDNEVKKLQAFQVLHGKKKPKPLQVRKRDYFRLSCALQGF